MYKKEWIEHCKWLDTFRGKIVTNNEAYKSYSGKAKNEKKDQKKKKNN